ncbi:uncharacterized protein K452DRAFT_242026 [Aplosporella prunicola CBS 121167]|uniref:Uncharacterized protein n=1 Tax=Aplosporella prunicola CBS 121167 TaxID=1176127 RepID=A0A6A6BRZ5_9PEZI|nr:uncharacterized protein K452DRAFT_242026 [Aplosporella prunicola CBS 121167]KAF2146869.1 hypothetical protein K452DRAFT_242026 [Aplosporella prunicola CBS 121167]
MTSYDDWGYPKSSRTNYHEGPGLKQHAILAAKRLLEKAGVYTPNAPSGKSWNVRHIFSVPNLLTVFWLFYLYWGERSSFRDSIEACEWSNWESWPQDATPHRLAFVADPQLVDPHTYPGRPWPLSTLTVAYTDQYLRRTFSLLDTELYPDTVIFLGDLFDGGREWTSDKDVSEERWKGYGDKFWLREYDRFGRIFFGHWGEGGMQPRVGQKGRKILAGLPGNHDLGFAAGVRTPIRKRFNAYFGDGNRVDVIANHTFISVDTVSLSALGHATGEEVTWRPTQDFLDNVQAEKKRAVARELRVQKGLSPAPKYSHKVVGTDGLAKATLPAPEADGAEFPTILLTHVPLYRSEGTPCGPLREHWPPATPPKGQSEPVNPDERNAIAVRGGYQYQNVLTREISKDITEKIGNVRYAFSGDDHDYCEVMHMGYPSAGGGIREITVKSVSWAMGIRKPGFVMLSMWNPVDEHGSTISSKAGTAEPTIQTHLCLMPDQLGIFIRYGALFGLSLMVLIIRAGVLAGRARSSTQSGSDTILPLSRNRSMSSAEHEKATAHHHTSRSDSSDGASSNSSTTADHKGSLSVRSSKPRTRNPSPSGGYGLPSAGSGVPLINYAGYFGPPPETREKKVQFVAPIKPKKSPGLFLPELRDSLLRVAAVVLVVYFWLTWRW